MQAIRAVALSRHTAPDFLMVGGLEHIQLRKLQHLPRCLFSELVALADHATGRVATSYAVLVALLDFDQSPGAHAVDKPSVQRIRTALEQLEALGLVTIDRKRNRRAKGLFLLIAPRSSVSASNAMSNSMSNRPRKARKPALARVSGPSAPDEQQTEQQGVQEEFIPPSPPLSTGPRPEVQAEIEQVVTRLRREGDEALAAARAAGAFQQAPPGGQEVAPCGRTPPGPAEPSPTVKSMRAQLKPQQTDEGPRPSDRLRQRRAQAANPASQRGGAPKASG